MKNNKFLALILIIVLTLATGCGADNYLKDENGNILVNEETGQSVQKNILCQPNKDGNLYKIYEQYNDQMNVKLEELPTCEEFNLGSNEYNGLWQALLVRPLAFLILKLGYLVKNFGVSVMLIGLFIRIILMPLNIKSLKTSEAMQKAQPEIMKIEKKYANRTDSESMMAKSQETMMVYQKYKINPVSGCLVALLQIPLFFAFLSAINDVPAIFEDSLFGMHLGMTPWKALTEGQYIYIVLIFLIIATTYYSFKNTMKTNPNNDMMKQMNYMLMFMIISISIASFSLPTAIAFYWIIINGFTVIQNRITKKILNKDKKESSMPVVTEAKTLLEALENAKNQLETEKIIYKTNEKVSGKLFKSKTIEVTAISYNELVDEIKKYLKELIENMGLEIQFESSIREDTFEVTLYSNNNSILIGKNGQNLKALETIVRAKINQDWGISPKIVLDVENYKEKKIQSLERLAIRVAKEVRATKVDVALDNMNSFERRVIHNKLTNFKGVSTSSEGEEPNRHVVIKAE